jgi:hypothetical protein
MTYESFVTNVTCENLTEPEWKALSRRRHPVAAAQAASAVNTVCQEERRDGLTRLAPLLQKYRPL